MLGGSWLLLTLLMIGMSWSAAVPPADDAVSATEAEDGTTTVEDPYALSVEEIEPASYAEYGYPDENELVGSRTSTSKTYVTETGKTALVTTDPIHYLDDGGVWQNIDLNIETTASGWAVTENTFKTEFSTDLNRGITIEVNENIDPILMGLNPSIVTIEGDGMSPLQYGLDETPETISTGGNVLRYPMGEGVSLDYQVTSTSVKQNLIIRDMPYFPDGFKGYFGIQEEMILPVGYSVFNGESPLRDGEVMKTNGTLEIRNIETGELLVTIPAPLVTDSNETGSLEPVFGQYILMQIGEQVHLTTVIDSDWLTNESRVYPVVIDPSVDVYASSTWYAYHYRYTRWGYTYSYFRSYSTSSIGYTCYGSGNYYTSCTSSSIYQYYAYWTIYRFNLQNVVPNGATVNDPNCSNCGVDFSAHVGRYYAGSGNHAVAVLKSGTSQSSTIVDPSSGAASTRAQRAMNSPLSSSSTTISDPGYYYYGGSVKKITMNSAGEDDVQDAIDGNAAGSSGNILGLVVKATTNEPRWYWCAHSGPSYYGCTGNSNKPHLEIEYTGGSDQQAPAATLTPFDGWTTYLTGSRTMYLELADASGINTTTAGNPHLWWRADSGSWSAVTASTLGTCAAGAACYFKATLPAQTAPTTGTKTIEYYWAYRDSPAPPNGGVAGTTGTSPSGGTGLPSNMNTHPSNPYSYEIEHIDNAADGDNKWMLKASGWNSYSYYSAQRYYDWQMTYYEPSREYHIEWDTSNCGTGSNSCFNAASVLDLRYYPNTIRYATSSTAQNNKEVVKVPGLSMSADDGPGMDLIFFHDGTKFGVMGYEESSGTGIGQPNGDGDIYTQLDYGSTDDGFVIVDIPGDITGYFGGFSWNASYNLNSANRNKFCISTNNHPLIFTRSTRTYGTYNNPCISSYSFYNYQYAWNGFMLPGYDGKVNNGWSIASKVSSIKPTPDTFPPEFDHGGLMDSYVDTSRSLTFQIKDVGDPAVGLDVTTANQPTMEYRVNWAAANADGQDGNPSSAGWTGWTTRSFSPVGAAIASCEMSACTWTTSIPGTMRGNTVEYRMTAQDTLGNVNTTTAYSYELKSPTKVFVLEWHDMTAGFNSGYNVNYQVRLYDVTNEIEFEYDTDSNAYYDYQYIGYQNPSATAGHEIRGRGAGFVGGVNPFSNNYRIATDGTEHSYETYAAGYTELFNYNEEFTGNNNGQPYTYYCTRYFSNYRADCSTVIDLPAGFDFEYFGSTYSGDSGHKIHAIRHGAMQFSTSSSTQSAQMMSSSWGTTMPTLPSGSSYAANVDLAPWWGYYAAYYCYYNSGSECSIRSKVIPFDGAGMDVNQDITTATIWDAEQSPIRVNPANGDYLQVSADLTIEAGVEVQIAEGKGIVFTGACNKLVANGNATHPVTIKNMGSAYAKGLAFTNGCATTDDRHTLTHTNFENLEIALSMGSRHGSAPHYNGNVGDFTLNDVTFTNVSTAISHGSGQGTNVDMSEVSVTNSEDSCMVFPDDSTITWIGGSATDCNTHAYSGQGAVETGDGTDVWIENVTVIDAAVNGIFGTADSLHLSNVTVDASAGFNTQQSGTAVAQTSTANSGTSLYAFNVEMANYVAALTTHATDSIHMEQLDSSGDSNGYWITPAGSASTTVGDTGWTMTDVSADGGLTIARTMPVSMDDIDLGGELKFSGTGPTTDLLTGKNVAAQGLSVNGCGWKIDFTNVDLGDVSNTADSWVSANCGLTTTSNVVSISDGTIEGKSAAAGKQNNFAYARNSILTLASMAVDGQTQNNAYLASAGTNGDIRLVAVSFRGHSCLDVNNAADTSKCWVEAASGTAKIYFGGTGEVSVYRSSVLSGTVVNTMQPGHKVTTAVHDPSSGAEMFSVGTVTTDINGAANALLITDLYERDGNGATVSSETYTDHTIRVAGAAGQNVTTPSDAWYTSGFALPTFAGDLPLEVGESIYLALEAFPMDFNGTTKDCAFFAANDSASDLPGPDGTGVYHTYQRQIITLSTDMVLDGCKVHLQGTSFRVNRDAGTNPTITLLNGGELMLTEYQGDTGHIKATSPNYPWTMVLGDNGLLTLNASWISDMNGGLTISDGTVNMINGAQARGSPNAALATATLNVDGGVLTMTDSSVQNANSGVGIHLEDTAASSLTNIIVKDAAVGIEVHDAAVAINGYTLTNNTVGMDIEGGMSLPTIYRSTTLSGEPMGWTTHEIDITSLAEESNYLQVGVNQVYMGGNSDPRRGSYYWKYFLTTDRYRIAVDDGTGLQNVTDSSVTGYYPWGNNDPAVQAGTHTYDGGVGGQPVWDCNIYGYRYNPGGSYQYAYYYYFLQYSNNAYTSAGNNNMEPNEFGFRYETAEHSGTANYYPYMFWGSYWPAFYHANTVFVPPEGFNGMWQNYNVCQNYGYASQMSTPAGGRVAYPIIDTSDPAIQEVKIYVDVVHYGADYYADRMDFVVRSGSTVGNLLDADYKRDFGTSSINNGQITGADTGLRIGGNRASADISTLTVTSPTNEGVLIDGTTGATLDALTVNGGKYGARMTSTAGGKMTMTNVDFDGQSQDGLVVAKDMNLEATGTLQNAAYCGLKVLSSSTGDWEFSNLAIDGNTVGVNHAGSGNVLLDDITMGSNNVLDVELSGSATLDFLEGGIDDTKVMATGSSKLTRLRGLDVTLTADGNPVPDDSPVKILSASNRVIDSGATTGGSVDGLQFIAWTYDASGKVTENLAGYQLVTVAMINYDWQSSSNNEGDFRYSMQTITLADAPGQTASASLTQYFDARTCYSYTTTSYDYLSNCNGLYYQNSRTLDRPDGGTMEEYGYYALPGTSSESAFNTDLENKTILLDTPYNYLTNVKTSLNNSLVFTTGTYNGETRVYNIAQYGNDPGALYMDGTTMIAMGSAEAESSNDAAAIRLGYSGTYGYGDYYISDSEVLGFMALGTGSGYYANDGDIEISDSLFTHYRTAVRASSSQLQDICIQTSGFDHVRIINNTFTDCGVGVYIPRNTYASSSYYVPSGSLVGTQDLLVKNNTFEDTQNLAMWFYLSANVYDAQFIGNDVEGTPPRYGVYNQDTTSYSFVAHDNTIYADNPVYSRSARQYTVTNNSLTGISDPSRACIYALNGYGTIRDNTCTDADGGISISGVRSGNEVYIEGNSIGFSAGRVPTSAIGIYVERCGLDEVYLKDNTVSTVMNALQTDGCTVTDNGSAYTAMSGVAARTWNVDSNSGTFSPAHLTNVCVGDSVKWTARAYYGGNTHTTTSDAGQAESWDSGSMNLGSSFVHTFTSVGNFTYASQNTGNPMTGSVNVTACVSNLATVGIDILGGGDDLTLNGVSVSGYGVGLEMTGGDLSLNAGPSAAFGGATVPTQISGDTVAVDVEDVDLTTNGAYLSADWHYGTALSAVSSSGNDDLQLTQLSTTAALGVLADGHENFRWNGGNVGSAVDYTALGLGILPNGGTVLKTANGASGTIENMSSTNGLGQAHLWGGGDLAVLGGLPGFACAYTAGSNPYDPNDCGGPTTVINAGAYSTITSIGNGVLNNGVLGDASNNYAPGNYSKLVIDSDAVIHEGNLLDLTVNHCPHDASQCSAASDVGLYMRSLTTTTFADGSVDYVPAGRAEYVSPSWRVNAGAGIAIDGNYLDWEGANLLNIADDMQPGIVAINGSTLAQMRVTWDSSFMYIALIGPTFTLTDGMAYLDTGPGGSSTGDSWHVTHTLGMEADYMLWMEDLNNWGIRKVMPTGNWVDVTASCNGIDSYLFSGNPNLEIPVSEFRLPWDCIGSPTHAVRWTALIQWDGVPGFGHAGEVAGVFPEQPFAVAGPGGSVSGQNFPVFGTFNLQGDDLDDGTLDDHLVLFRTYTGSGTPGAPHIYQIVAKTRNLEGDYWDWGTYAPLIMTTNQDVTMNILRAKPVIENLVDVSYDEDSGGHTITLVDKASDMQDASTSLSWFVTDHPGNTHSYPTPYTYTLQGATGTAGGLSSASLDVNTLENQFGGHRLVLTVIDEHGLTAQQSLEIGIWNVNDAPVICNTNRPDCLPILYDGGGGNINVKDENFLTPPTLGLGDAANDTGSGSFIVDMENEQTQSDWNNEAISQTYTWSADEGNCIPFSTSVNQNVIVITENTANEAGGNCDIVLSLSDGASENSDATDVTVNFIVNPVNDAPVIKEFDANAATPVYVETANGSLQLDWFWDVMEDDENAANLTFDLHRLMHDNDHYDRNDGSGQDELTWSISATDNCDYENYFTITVDNTADTLALDLIPDAATNAPTSEIDFLQDADGDGVADNGIHQMQPNSGVYCTVHLWLNDTATAPSHIDYAQHSSGVYTPRSVRETISIQVHNTPEARPDYKFDELKGYDWLNINAVLPGTRVPIEIDITNDGDDPALYNYAHDVQVRFYTDDNPTLIQDQVTLSWNDNEVPDIGEAITIRGYVTLTSPTESVRTFIEVRTINPLTGEYINDIQRRAALEELNWDNNNLTTTETNDGLPSMVRLRGATTSVTGFAPGLLAVSLVGAFVGALLMQSRKEEDAEEIEAMADDEEAVSPVIATILLVAITVVLSGVIYVWAQSLASETTGKSATPRMSFDQEARFDSNNEANWYWKINVIDGEELASQAILVKVQWMNASGVDKTYSTNLANSSGVYGFIPSNSPNLVTYKDSINCAVDCSAGFGTSDFVQIRMTDPFDGNAPIQDAVITMYYAPAGGTSYTMMTWTASYNPPSISPQF